MKEQRSSSKAVWHRMAVAKIMQQLESDQVAGLDEAVAAQRLVEHGPNVLVDSAKRSAGRILWEQLSGAMVVLLLVAASVSLVLHETRDAIAIGIIILLNALLGFTQDSRAERAMAALKKLAVPHVRVRRGGHVREFQASELVPGDIALLEAGNLVPADCRVVSCARFRVQEAALTGESEPVDKREALMEGEGDCPIAERCNMVYMGTMVSNGRAEVVVVATGMATELGHIAHLLHGVERSATPLQRRLAKLGRRLAVAALVIVALVFIFGLLRGEEPKVLFMTALSLAVAAVPEGLPAVATVALALGARRMLKRRALIRKLPAVETLGSVTVICSDKTGTLTENRMSVEVVDLAGGRINLTEYLQDTVPGLTPDDAPGNDFSSHAALPLLLVGGDLCNDAQLEDEVGQPGFYHALGDPTEGALVIAAARAGYLKTDLEKVFVRVDEQPFDSERKRMTTVHQVAAESREVPAELQAALDQLGGGVASPYVAFTKGAVDELLEHSTEVWVEAHREPLDDPWRSRIQQANNELAEKGMRVMGVCVRGVAEIPAGDLEDEMVFVGMVGLQDPPRAEVKEAVARCRTAGIRPIMITGDHPLTARHIAQALGITETSDVLTGQEVAELNPEELSLAVERVSVFARVAPEHKLMIVHALQEHGHIVAMTGDGVNDAPALKQADIGVAMGIAGTDVAKEAADTVLLDDNFASVVNAVEEGRTIFDNIRKFVIYTLTSNAGEIWVMLLAPFLGMPLPLLPLQILWVNLVTDGLPGLALALEPTERNVMRRPPVPPGQGVLQRSMILDIFWIGLLMGGVSLAVGYAYWQPNLGSGPSSWQTMLFTVLTFSQMGNVMALRSTRDSLWRVGVFSNPGLLGAVLLTFALQLGVIYLPFMQTILHTTALSLKELGLCLVLSTLVFWAVELRKAVARRRESVADCHEVC